MTFKKGDPNAKLGGRKKGVPNKNARLTDEMRKQLANAAGGISPLEFACSILRDEDAVLKDKQWACELLMPYMHRRLPTAVNMTTNSVATVISPEDLQKMDSAELDKLISLIMGITKDVIVTKNDGE